MNPKHDAAWHGTETAQPKPTAAGLLATAEHDPGTSYVDVTAEDAYGMWP